MKAKVIILGGNARSGKTTLAIMLQKIGFNRISFDDICEALEKGLNINLDNDSAEILYKYFEITVEQAINNAKINEISTVIDMYDFTPEYVGRLPYQKEIEVYYLAYPNCTKEEVKYNVIHYAKLTDWIVQINESYLDECVERFDRRNKDLVESCSRYNYELIDTSSGDERTKILNNLYKKITK
jgi:tRNA A37 N6-isopentenylltransferase MiaA